MATGIGRAFVGLGRVLRDVGSAARGAMPPLRSPDGTYGMQRANSRALDEQRRERYPRD